MGRIILTIPGPWTELPEIKTSLELELLPPDPGIVREFEQLSRSGDSFTAEELKAIRKHQSLLRARIDFEQSGDLAYAKQAAKCCKSLCKSGAYGIFVETALKVIPPEPFGELNCDDVVSLFHLFVEFYGDRKAVQSEGMQAFGLPDVVVPFTRETRSFAQGAAFGLAARMVCDRMQPREGQRFRASESAHAYCLHWQASPAPEDEEDADFVNDAGQWRMDFDEEL